MYSLFNLIQLLPELLPPESTLADEHGIAVRISCSYPGCGKNFPSKRQLRRHKRAHREKKHKCDVDGCLAAFTAKSKLIRHMTRHTGIKAYQCPRCSKKFAYQESATIHLSRHTGLRPFVCGFEGCVKAFFQAGNRNQHQKTHERRQLKRKRNFEQLARSPDMSLQISGQPRLFLPSPEKPEIGPTKPTVFSFNDPARSVVAVNCNNAPTQINDWWLESPDDGLVDEALDISFQADSIEPFDFEL